MPALIRLQCQERQPDTYGDSPQSLKNGMRLIRKADKPDAARPMPLIFKVPADFRCEFKTYAAHHNKKLNQLLYEAFAALKAKHAE